MAGFWMVRAGEGGYLAETFEEKGLVAVGWPDAGDLSNVRSLDAMRACLAETYPQMKPSAISAWASMLLKFVDTIKEGDRILTVHQGVILPLAGFNDQALRTHFKLAAHNALVAPMVFQLVLRGQDPLAWKVESDYGAVSLLDPSSQVQAEHRDPYWWRVHDPDLAAELARSLVEQTGLEVKFADWLLS